MKIQSQRGGELDSYISSHSDCRVGEWPLEIGGIVDRLSFYKLPINMLRYNVNNGRFVVEIKEWESINNKILDANDSDDAKQIRKLLLSLDKNDTELLEEDLSLKGQIEPGVITHDGYVINGNRRMAVFQQMHEKESTGKWEKLDVIRLPPSVSNKDLWRIEAGLQLSKDKVAEYHPVNELLKIKEGIASGLSPKEIAAAMYGHTKDEIEISLERLELIDDFLEFCGQKANYGLIKTFRLHEHFIDIQKTILSPAKRQGQPNRVIQKRLIETFALIKVGFTNQGSLKKGKKKDVTHWDIRALGKVFTDSDAEHEFSKVFASASKDIKKISSISPELILEGFQTAREVLSNKEDRDKPAVLIERANKALESIDRKSKHLREEKAKSAFQKLSKTVGELRKEIEK